MIFLGGLITGAIVGAIVSYLVLRNNKSIKDKIDSVVEPIDKLK